MGLDSGFVLSRFEQVSSRIKSKKGVRARMKLIRVLRVLGHKL